MATEYQCKIHLGRLRYILPVRDRHICRPTDLIVYEGRRAGFRRCNKCSFIPEQERSRQNRERVLPVTPYFKVEPFRHLIQIIGSLGFS